MLLVLLVLLVLSGAEASGAEASGAEASGAEASTCPELAEGCRRMAHLVGDGLSPSSHGLARLIHAMTQISPAPLTQR